MLISSYLIEQHSFVLIKQNIKSLQGRGENTDSECKGKDKPKTIIDDLGRPRLTTKVVSQIDSQPASIINIIWSSSAAAAGLNSNSLSKSLTFRLAWMSSWARCPLVSGADTVLVTFYGTVGLGWAMILWRKRLN